MSELDTTKEGSTTPEWLEKLQQESWQAEILISGGSLVGVLGLIGNIDVLLAILRYSTRLDEGNVGLVLVMCWFPLIFLAAGFLVHLLLRGFWIALIGANYVFPSGINTEKLAMKGRFGNLIKNASNVPYLIKLDKLCGMVFALTFFVIFSFIGFLLFIGIMQLVISIPTSGFPEYVDGIREIVVSILLIFGALGMIDFLTMGFFKRIKWISWVYYPIHYVVSVITFSASYRRLYYMVVSNINRWYIIFALAAQLTVAFLIINGGARLSSDIAPISSSNEYDFLELKEHIVSGKTLQLSIMHNPRLEEGVFEEWQVLNPQRKEKSFAALGPEEKIRLISSGYEILIDSAIIGQPSWVIERKDFFTFHMTRLTTLVDVSLLPVGSHQLKVRMKKFGEEKKKAAKLQTSGTVQPFDGRAYFYVNR